MFVDNRLTTIVQNGSKLKVGMTHDLTQIALSPYGMKNYENRPKKSGVYRKALQGNVVWKLHAKLH